MIALSGKDLAFIILGYRDLVLSFRFSPGLMLVVLAIAAYWRADFGVWIPILLASSGGLWFWFALGTTPSERAWLTDIRTLMENCRHEEAEARLTKPPIWFGPAARVRTVEQWLRLHLERGDLLAEYNALQALRGCARSPGEKRRADVAEASLRHRAGDYRTLKRLLSTLEQTPSRDPKERIRLAILKSHLHENQGEYKAAKQVILDLIAEDERYQCPELYNNLAGQESFTRNSTQSQHYFEKALDAIGQTYYCYLSPIIYHNLIDFAARNGHVDVARSWLRRYRDVVDKSNRTQYLAYLNEQIELARQLKDLSLLLEAYALIDIEIVPNVPRSERLSLYVSELRMRINDPLPIAEHLARIEQIFSDLASLPFPKSYISLKELLNFFSHLPDQVVATRIPPEMSGTMQALLSRIMEVMKEMPRTIREYRRTIPEALVGESLYWMEELHYLSRVLSTHIPENDGTRYFRARLAELLEQKKKGADVENLQIQLRASMMICEWYLLNKDSLEIEAREEALVTCRAVLGESGGWLQRHLGVTRYADMFIGQAAYELGINENLQRAAFWIRQFDELDCSVNHYAMWLRREYWKVKAALQDS